MKKRKKSAGLLYIFLILGVLILLFGSLIVAKKYAPTSERMSLDEVFELNGENEAALIIDAVYDNEDENRVSSKAVILSGTPYINIDFLKENLDNGYVFDEDEGILRYTTDSDIVSVNYGDSFYDIGRDSEDIGASIIEKEGGITYLALPFVSRFTDISYVLYTDPDRIVIEKAGWEKRVATVKKNTVIRRLGGPKSKIGGDSAKGDEVIVTEELGKWTKVLSSEGVIGYAMDKYLIDKRDEVAEANLKERDYRHIQMQKTVSLGWFQVMSKAGNSAMNRLLDKAGDSINVISPTWFRLSDNKGGIENIASYDCVNACHDRGIQVWALVNNFDNTDIDFSAVLSSATARDNLINNLIGAAIAYDIDGINVDFEYLQESDADGFLEFVRELSIKCENNDLILSVDNYVPSTFHAFYDYAEQGKYADYVVIMAYDEHYAGSDDPGSVSSIGFVKTAVSDMLTYVPADQIVLGLPFYYRLWATDSTGLKSSVVHMSETEDILKKYDATTTWLDDVGQNYAEFENDGVFYQTWIEEPKSLGLKLSVIKDNDLGGAAFWKLGCESDAAWDVIDEYVK